MAGEREPEGREFAGRVEDGLEDAIENGLPKLGRAVRRGALKLVRRAKTRGARTEEIVEPAQVARAIISQAVAHAYAVDTRNEQLAAPNFYYVVVPWLSFEHLYQPHMAEIVANIERDVQERLASRRYLIRVHPHVAIAGGSQLPDDKLQVTTCYTKREWYALRGEPMPPEPEPEPEQARPSAASGRAPEPGERTVLDSDVHHEPRATAYVTIPGVAGRLEVRNGSTIGRAHSDAEDDEADVLVPADLDDPRLKYVSHVNGVFRSEGEGPRAKWSYEQLGPNVSIVASVGGSRCECRKGDPPVRIGEGDRIFLSRMETPVVFHDGTHAGAEPVAPTVFRPQV